MKPELQIRRKYQRYGLPQTELDRRTKYSEFTYGQRMVALREARNCNEFEVLRSLMKNNSMEFVPHGLPEPTRAIPGSPEKIEILRQRLEAGQEMNHPDDLRFSWDCTESDDPVIFH